LLFTDLRIALYLAWAAGLIYSGSHSKATNFVAWIVSYQIVSWVTVALERSLNKRRERRIVAYYQMFGDEERKAMIAKIWSVSFRRFIREQIALDIVPTVDGSTERFPFSVYYRRRTLILFWVSAVAAAVALVVPQFMPFQRALGWSLIGFGTVCVLAASVFWRRATFANTVLEITPYTIAVVAPSGERTSLSWKTKLALVNRPRHARLDLVDINHGTVIPLHFARVGLKRAVDLVVQYANFPDPQSAT
jgi:hypothetical protein